jgi:hypothetical protein
MKLRNSVLSVGALGASLALVLGSPAFADTVRDGAPDAPAASAATQLPNGGLAVKDFQILGPLDQNSHVSARDNGQSVFYGGKSYWFFDDTIETDPDAFLTSTAAVTSDLTAADNIQLHSTTFASEADTGAPTEFVPLSTAETDFQNEHASTDCTGSTDPNCGTVFGFWPGAAVADPATTASSCSTASSAAAASTPGHAPPASSASSWAPESSRSTCARRWPRD